MKIRLRARWQGWCGRNRF